LEESVNMVAENKKHRVVIIGGGFGGLHAVKQFAGNKSVEITLIDKRNFHLFQPLLYQVATGGLSSANIASPIRSVVKKQKNVRVLMEHVKDIDLASRRVRLDFEDIEYDSLIVATGTKSSYFGHNEWERFAPSLKTIEDAIEMRRRILLAFEMAEIEKDPEKIRQWLTFVVVGGGPTGVELAGAIAEISRSTLRKDFRNIHPQDANIILIEGSDRILGAYEAILSQKAEEQLAGLGVKIVKKTFVTDISDRFVKIKSPDGKEEAISCRTVLWAAGIESCSLGKKLSDQIGAQTDRMGRVFTNSDCSLPQHPEVFVIGDLGHFKGRDGKPLPGVAQVAIQQGRYVSKLIQRRLKNGNMPPFAYRDLGSMATIGRSRAVAQIGFVKLWGYLAWAAWLFIHLIGLVQYSNRVLVLAQWTWNYWSFSRTARLITYPCCTNTQLQEELEKKRCDGDNAKFQ